MPLDDSWIHLQFARQLAAGNGLSYGSADVGWISGSTSPLWTALLSLAFLLPGSPLLWAKLAGCALFAATVFAVDRLAVELELDPGPRRLAGILTATTHWLIWSALSGMEIVLFGLLSVWGIVLHLRERDAPEAVPKSLAFFAASILARPEGILLFLLAIGDRSLRFVGDDHGLRLTVTQRIPSLVTGLATLLVVVLPTALFYRAVGGSFLPTTFAVKTTPVDDLIPSARYLSAVLDIFFRSQPVMLLLAGAGVLGLVERLGTRRDRGLLLALWPIAFALGYSVLAAPNGPIVVGNFGRYYFPLLPVLVLLGALGLERAARRLGPGWPRALLVIALLAPQLWSLASGPPRYLQTLANVEDSDVAAARWLRDRLPPEALLAVQDIGALKYHLPNEIVDLTGIVNPDILPYLHGTGPDDPSYWETRLHTYLAGKRPDYLIVFPRSYPQLTSGALGFTEIRRFEIPNNVTMAGNELAIFSTPWTQHPLRSIDE